MDKKQNLNSEALITLSGEESEATTNYRMLFAKVDSLCRAGDKKLIAVTSSIKGEGKTTTVANLAIVAARDFGRRCLVLDGDSKSPALGKRFGFVNEPGIINVIKRECVLSSVLKRGPVDNLAVLPLGKSGSRDNSIWVMEEIDIILRELSAWFDYIFVDTPPILPLFDMNIISEKVHAIIVVARSGETSRVLLEEAIKSLGSKKVIGSVLNGYTRPWGAGNYGYGY